MYYTLYQKRVYRVYQGGVYPDTADDPCPAALVAGYSDTPRYTGMYRYSYTADTRYIPIQHPSLSDSVRGVPRQNALSRHHTHTRDMARRSRSLRRSRPAAAKHASSRTPKLF